MTEVDAPADPIFDRGMTARANGLPLQANPHDVGCEAHKAWVSGWLAAETRAAEIAAAGALL